MRPNKKPTRRKPDRPTNQVHLITPEDYEPPFYTWLYAVLLVAALLGVPVLMSWAHLNGWY